MTHQPKYIPCDAGTAVVSPTRSKEAEAIIRRVEIVCELFETAFEIKSLKHWVDQLGLGNYFDQI